VSTKFCTSQFKARKSANKALRNAIIKAKGYDDLDGLVKDWTGADELTAIEAAIEARATSPPTLFPATDDTVSSPSPAQPPLPLKVSDETMNTPPGWRGNPDPSVVHDAPLLPANEHRTLIPAGVSKRDPGTPTPLTLPPRAELAPARDATLPVM